MSPDAKVTLEHSDCPLSCPPSDMTLLHGSDRLHDLPGRFTVVRCTCCGLVRTSPRPTPDTIGAYYPADYGPYKGTLVTRQDGDGKRGIRGRLIALGQRLFDTKATTLPKMKPGSMLEIGCASGSFLHAMAERGWSVDGIEFSPEAAAAARALGYHVSTGSVESVDRAEGLYNLVVGWMVLEHLHDPVGALRKIATWSKPNARLAISVPDAGAAEFRLFGARWYALQLPTHLYHYDASSIRKVLDAGGWRVTRIQRHRTLANLIASFGYWLHDKGYAGIGSRFIRFPETGGRLGAFVLFPLAYLAAFAGQTGRMTVWAERKTQ